MSASSYVGPLCDLTPAQLQEAFGVSDFFIYEVDFTGLASGASALQTFTVQADSNFLWQRATFQADIAGAAFTYSSRPIPNITLDISDTSSGRHLSSSPSPVPNFFGFGSDPADLINPRWFRSNTQVTVAATNYDAAVTYNLRLSFIGTKFFQTNSGYGIGN